MTATHNEEQPERQGDEVIRLLQRANEWLHVREKFLKAWFQFKFSVFPLENKRSFTPHNLYFRNMEARKGERGFYRRAWCM